MVVRVTLPSPRVRVSTCVTVPAALVELLIGSGCPDGSSLYNVLFFVGMDFVLLMLTTVAAVIAA